ncbi:MAG: hypothetical protein WB565_00700 [Acidimicrobiales bacterium]
MTEDYRSDPMPTPEGKGNARRKLEKAWASYVGGVNKVPGVKPLGRAVGGAVAVDLLGFWLCWQLEGGFEGLRKLGLSRSAIYRRISLFRKVTGQHPDEYQLSGVTIDLQKYVRQGATKGGH